MIIVLVDDTDSAGTWRGRRIDNSTAAALVDVPVRVAPMVEDMELQKLETGKPVLRRQFRADGQAKRRPFGGVR